jgi:hypothetical protein
MEALAARPNSRDEVIENRLVRGGLGRSQARRLLLFVPEACCRACFEPLGTQFPETYRLQNADGKTSVLKLEDEIEYAEAVAAGRYEARKRGGRDRMLSIARRSASFDAIARLTRSGSKLKDIRCGELVVPEEALSG